MMLAVSAGLASGNIWSMKGTTVYRLHTNGPPVAIKRPPQFQFFFLARRHRSRRCIIDVRGRQFAITGTKSHRPHLTSPRSSLIIKSLGRSSSDSGVANLLSLLRRSSTSLYFYSASAALLGDHHGNALIVGYSFGFHWFRGRQRANLARRPQNLVRMSSRVSPRCDNVLIACCSKS